jgi:hypothetical protein
MDPLTGVVIGMGAIPVFFVGIVAIVATMVTITEHREKRRKAKYQNVVPLVVTPAQGTRVFRIFRDKVTSRSRFNIFDCTTESIPFTIEKSCCLQNAWLFVSNLRLVEGRIGFQMEGGWIEIKGQRYEVKVNHSEHNLFCTFDRNTELQWNKYDQNLCIIEEINDSQVVTRVGTAKQLSHRGLDFEIVHDEAIDQIFLYGFTFLSMITQWSGVHTRVQHVLMNVPAGPSINELRLKANSVKHRVSKRKTRLVQSQIRQKARQARRNFRRKLDTAFALDPGTHLLKNAETVVIQPSVHLHISRP